MFLARNAKARVKMGHLSDSFLKDPKEAFPDGKAVNGRVISAADGRCVNEYVVNDFRITVGGHHFI